MKTLKKLFEVQTNLTTYKYPIVKILICLTIIILSLVRNMIFQISNPWINAAITLLCFVLAMPSFLCIYISVGELFIAYENRKNKNCRASDLKQLTIEAVAKIVSENDIVEIEVCINNKIVKIGASADCKYTSSVFEDKLYYISSSEYETVELFTEALVELFPQGTMPVSKIDGLPLDCFRW